MRISFLPQHALPQLSGVSHLAMSVLLVIISSQAHIHAYSPVTQQGLGRDIHILLPDKLETLLKGIFISDIGWAIAICLTKCSILAFYWRLFNSQGRLFRIAVRVFVAVMINWGLVVVSVNLW